MASMVEPAHDPRGPPAAAVCLISDSPIKCQYFISPEILQEVNDATQSTDAVAAPIGIAVASALRLGWSVAQVYPLSGPPIAATSTYQ